MVLPKLVPKSVRTKEPLLGKGPNLCSGNPICFPGAGMGSGVAPPRPMNSRKGVSLINVP